MYICKSFKRNQSTSTNSESEKNEASINAPKSESEKMRHLDITYYCIAFINVKYLYYFYCNEGNVRYNILKGKNVDRNMYLFI